MDHCQRFRITPDAREIIGKLFSPGRKADPSAILIKPLLEV